MSPVLLPEALEFDWDAGNAEKNWRRYGVRDTECEELFTGSPLLVSVDATHSDVEARSLALGRTRTGRRLFLSFTLRAGKIRVVSARDMSRRERRSHEEARDRASERG